MIKTFRSVANCVCTIAMLLLVTVVSANTLFAGEPDVRADKVLDGFAKGIEQMADLDDAQRTELLGLIKAQRKDEYLRSSTISVVLTQLHPKFRGALEALAEEETEKAIGPLAELAKSEDPYLAAEASYYLARAHMMEERSEDALPLLERLTGDLADKTLFVGNAQYLLGTSQALLLHRKKAIASLKTFLKNNPNASERLRVGAFRQIALLESVQKGSLDDVYDRMNFSRRKLSLERSGDRTQREQDNIVAMLDVLIKEAEDKEKKGSGSGSGSGGSGQGGQGGIQPGSGAERSTAPEGAGNIGPLRRRNSSRNAWDVTRKKERDKVLAGLKGKFPDRYRKLIEQYLKNLQDEEK